MSELQQVPDDKPELALDVSLERTRALHRVWRALNDGDCPKCHVNSTAQGILRNIRGDMTCPNCQFHVTGAEIRAIEQAFAPAMNAAVAIFEEWRMARETEARNAVITELQAFREQYGISAAANLDPEDCVRLMVAFRVCGMEGYPVVVGDPNGTRASLDSKCWMCRQPFHKHPADWRAIGYMGRPVLRIMCDGHRVKL